VRDFRPRVDPDDPRRTFPYISVSARKFVVPIRPDYHTELLPDSILNTESPKDFIESKPNRNALSKVYISRSWERDLKTGDIIVFYRTKSNTGPAYFYEGRSCQVAGAFVFGFLRSHQSNRPPSRSPSRPPTQERGPRRRLSPDDRAAPL
jgi:hypothetical protein